MRVRNIAVVAALTAMSFAGMPSANAQTRLGLVAGGTYTGVIANGLTIAYDCTAAGAGDVVSVAITRCQITTATKNSTIALPGPTATIAATVTVPIAPFQLCYAATFTFTDASTYSLSGCNTLVPNVGGLPQLAGAGFTAA